MSAQARTVDESDDDNDGDDDGMVAHIRHRALHTIAIATQHAAAADTDTKSCALRVSKRERAQDEVLYHAYNINL